MKVGDTVRYLNTTGGGVITRLEGNLAYVEEDGFETPVLAKEIVVVLPAGHQPSSGARLMFDQSAYDAGKKSSSLPRATTTSEKTMPMAEVSSESIETSPEPIEETPHGNEISLTLAFEPADAKRLSQTSFAAVLVNDSNYYISFAFSSRGDEAKGWTPVYQGTVAPNELIDLAEYTHADLTGIERVALQGIAFKKEKEFELRDPINTCRHLDITKFHKLHCFRPGIYFDTPVLEFPLIKSGRPTDRNTPTLSQLEALEQSLGSKEGKKQLRNKGERRPRKEDKPGKISPFKLLEPIEIDLHIGELTDTTAGMRPADMLEMQLQTVRRVMKEHSKRIGQKIIFIHGKGEGVLRQAVIKLLRHEYPKAELQDASFREYGFGATLVTLH
ncbi:MAG: DUF2027 domain-containing protein [Clostridium sp.]|nr:DUF2027 domain-containing protein [Prevotella sp.]MCM1428577.1 DUF2027 domain-containing protein [Clostridium sp.]